MKPPYPQYVYKVHFRESDDAQHAFCRPQKVRRLTRDPKEVNCQCCLHLMADLTAQGEDMTTKDDIPNLFKVHEAKFASDAETIKTLQGELKEAKAQIVREKQANSTLRDRLALCESYSVSPAMMTATEVEARQIWRAMHDLITGIDYGRRERGVYDRPTDYRKVGYEIGRRL